MEKTTSANFVLVEIYDWEKKNTGLPEGLRIQNNPPGISPLIFEGV